MWLSKLLLLGFVAAVVSTSVSLDLPLENDVIIEAVNKAKTTWTAGRNFNPSMKKSFLKNLLGVKRNLGGSSLPKYVLDDRMKNLKLPKNFDARAQWSDCNALQTVRDQGPCGSCWAVAAAAAFTDRLCIASKGEWNSQLSAEDLLSCCDACGDGCDGGDPEQAWEYFMSAGVVTGGDYKSNEGCQPYTLPACEHHVNGSRKSCDAFKEKTPPCKTKCYNKKYTTPYAKDFHKVKNPFFIRDDISSTMSEIYTNGPLEASFSVYEDFLSYKSGVYHHTAGDLLGGHAVKLIGWGVESGTQYWLAVNNWNNDWGEQGLFKIKRGNDECGFESAINGGVPVLD